MFLQIAIRQRTVRETRLNPIPNDSKEPNSELPSLFWTPLVIIAAVAFAVEIPFFFKGTPSGHDVEFHLYSWLEVVAQWKHGVFYPRWAALAHFGYGEPRFIFYPPASWMLGAAITRIFPWSIATPVYIWIALALAGASMFALARRWLTRRDAIFAAALYAANPYHLVIVYWRSAFAELLAACLLPMLVLLVLRVADARWRELPSLALLLGAAWLINAPAAVMIHYSLGLLLVLVAWRRRAWSVLWEGAAAVLLGATLASFYLVPAIYEQRWAEIAQSVSAGSRPQDNFLFIHTTDPDHDAFNRVVSWLALSEMVIVFVAAWLSRRWRERLGDAWDALLAWAAACGVLLFPITAWLWDILPKMKYMQFPWRWLLCLSMVMSLLVTLAFRRWGLRLASCALMLVVVILAWNRIQAPWWDNTGDLREMQDNMETGAGYEGTDEYTPLGADPSAIDKDARRVTIEGPAHGAIRVLDWTPESKSFTAEMSAADQVKLRLFAYPAWRVDVNGRNVDTGQGPNGQILVPVEAGMNRVRLTFMRTWDRTLGGWLSCAALVFLVFWVVRNRAPAASRS